MIHDPKIRAVIAALDRTHHENPSDLRCIEARTLLMRLDLAASEEVPAEQHDAAAAVLKAAGELLAAFVAGHEPNTAPLRKLLDTGRVPNVMRVHALGAVALVGERDRFPHGLGSLME